MPDRISKQDFVSGYIKTNELGLKSEDDYNLKYVALPCDCQEPGCLGWGTLPKQLVLLHHHCMSMCHATINGKWVTIMRVAEKYLQNLVVVDQFRQAQLEKFICDLEADIFSLEKVNKTTIREALKRQYNAFHETSGASEDPLISDKKHFLRHLEKALFGNKE